MEYAIGSTPLTIAKRTLENLTVLIVEDEFLIALEAQRMLEDAGAGLVILASSVGEVEKLLADGPRIDAAVLDLRLGGEDATPLMDDFQRRTIPFLLTTGFDAAAMRNVPVLAKPYRETDFVDAVAELVQRRVRKSEP